MPSRGAIDVDGEERPLLSWTDSGEPAEVRSKDGLPKVQVATILLSYFVESVVALFAFPFLGNVSRSFSSGPLLMLAIAAYPGCTGTPLCRPGSFSFGIPSKPLRSHRA